MERGRGRTTQLQPAGDDVAQEGPDAFVRPPDGSGGRQVSRRLQVGRPLNPQLGGLRRVDLLQASDRNGELTVPARQPHGPVAFASQPPEPDGERLRPAVLGQLSGLAQTAVALQQVDGAGHVFEQLGQDERGLVDAPGGLQVLGRLQVHATEDVLGVAAEHRGRRVRTLGAADLQTVAAAHRAQRQPARSGTADADRVAQRLVVVPPEELTGQVLQVALMATRQLAAERAASHGPHQPVPPRRRAALTGAVAALPPAPGRLVSHAAGPGPGPGGPLGELVEDLLRAPGGGPDLGAPPEVHRWSGRIGLRSGRRRCRGRGQHHHLEVREVHPVDRVERVGPACVERPFLALHRCHHRPGRAAQAGSGDQRTGLGDERETRCPVRCDRHRRRQPDEPAPVGQDAVDGTGPVQRERSAPGAGTTEQRRVDHERVGLDRALGEDRLAPHPSVPRTLARTSPVAVDTTSIDPS